jgi:Carbohydrate binding module (family 6)
MERCVKKIGNVLSFTVFAIFLMLRADAFADPTLPQTFDVPYQLPTGTVRTVGDTGNAVANGTNFQTQLNIAAPGDVIVLQAGARYQGNFVLPNKSGTGWIYIQSSAVASLGAPGDRVAPGDAALMARLEAPDAAEGNDMPAITTAPGAHEYRLVGLEITTLHTTTAYAFYATVLFGNGNQTSADVPTNIVIDRCYIHGTAGSVRNGVILNGSRNAVLDSYISDFHEINQESHAILGWNGPGPFKIVNNHLEAAAVVMMWGGGNTPSISGLVPSDIEIKHNHFYKDPAWLGNSWYVKNLFEIKNGRRVLLEGNILENNWIEADQHGFAIVLTPRNVNFVSDMSWAIVQDVTVRKNIIRGSVAGVSILGRDYAAPSQQTTRILFRDNLFSLTPDYNPPNVDYFEGNLFQLFGGCSGGVCQGAVDVWLDHNTLFHDTQSIVRFDIRDQNNNPIVHPGFIYRNNISNVTSAPDVNAGIIGEARAEGTVSLEAYSPGSSSLFQKNVLRDPLRGDQPTDSCGGMPYPPGNFCPREWSQVQFVNFSGGDYHLAATSPYKNAGTDGKNIGADIDALLAATACVESGDNCQPPPPPSCGAPPRAPFYGTAFAVPGTFEAEDFDCGGEGLAYHDAIAGNAGGQYRTSENVDIVSNSPAAGLRVNNIQTGEWLTYSINVAQAGVYRIEAAVSSQFTTSRFHFEIDGVNVSGTVSVPNTGSWITFQWVGASGINIGAGVHILKIYSEQEYFDLDAIRITAPFSGTPFAVPATFQAEDFDKGGEGVAYHDAVPGNAGGQYRTSEDVDIVSNSPAPGLRVNNFDTGEWLTYSINVATAGLYRIEAAVSTQFTNTRFHLEIDGVDVSGPITPPPTADWITFEWIGASNVNLTAGGHVLKIVSEQQWFDIDALRIVP